MKKYLFGLTAMLVGAGLMFVFTHTEVSADNTEINTRDAFYKELKEFKETTHCVEVDVDGGDVGAFYCKTKNRTCFQFHTSNRMICDKESWLFK